MPPKRKTTTENEEESDELLRKQARTGDRDARQASTSSFGDGATSSQTSPDLSTSSPSGTTRKPRRQASTREPVQSFAYGAQEDPNQKRKSIGNTSANGGLRGSSSSNNIVGTASNNSAAQTQAQDAKTRYTNLRERQRQRSRTPTTNHLPLNTSAESPRRSKRLSETGSQDGAGLNASDSALALRQTIETIEEDQAVEEPRSAAAPPAASRSRSNFSPGAARSHASGSGSGNGGVGVNRGSGLGHLSSFYLSRPESVLPDDIANPQDNARMLAPSLLRGAQKPSHDPMSPPDGMDMTSFRSSEMGDSRSNDYEEDSAIARQFDEQMSPPMLSSSRGWLGSLVGSREEGRNGSRHGPGQRRGRISDENKAYRPPAQDEESDDNDSDLSAEGRKHGHRRKKENLKMGARGGRDDNEIWKSKKRKGRSSKTSQQDGEGDAEGEDVGAEDETLDVPTDADTTTETAINKRPASNARKSRASPTKKKPKYDDHQPDDGKDEAQRSTLSRYLWGVIGAVLTAFIVGALVHRDSALSGSRAFDFSGAAPGTAAEYGQRLVDVEKRLASSFSGLDKKIAGISKTTSARIEELASEGRVFATSLQKLERTMEASKSGLEARIQRAEQDVHRSEKERQTLRDALSSIEQQVHDGDTVGDAKVLEKRLSALQDRMDRNEAKISQMKEATDKTTKLADKAHEGLASLEKKLPSQIAVRTDSKTGQPVLDASLLAALKKVFAEKGSEPKAPSGDTASTATPRWDTFIAENRENLQALMVETLDDGIDSRTQSGVILDREKFTQLLGRELRSAKRALEEKFNENFSTMQSNIEANLKNSSPRSGGRATGKQTIKTSTDSPTWAYDYLSSALGEHDDITAADAVIALIQAALNKYSADRTGKPDFALATAGGRIIPSLTSPTFADVRARAPSYVSTWFGARGNSPSPIVHRVPHLAIHHDTSQGMCWPFAGEEGQLGIGLSRKIIVTDVTLDHLPLENAYGEDRSAPRDVTVWGLVERKEDLLKLKSYRANKFAMRSQAEQALEEGGMDEPAPAPPAPNHLLLASFTYDLSKGASAVQTFPASTEAQQMQIPIQIVKVHFTSNHGNRQFTCVYRVRIHGEEWNA